MCNRFATPLVFAALALTLTASTGCDPKKAPPTTGPAPQSVDKPPR